jgi:hypothetical protein
VNALKGPRLLSQEGYLIYPSLTPLICLGMGEIPSDALDGSPSGPSSMLLLRRVSAPTGDANGCPLTNLIIGHEGWTGRGDLPLSSMSVHGLIDCKDVLR